MDYLDSKKVNRNDIKCECYDENCQGDHDGYKGCQKPATVEIDRIDMVDAGSMIFCQACAEDAFESGLFRNLGEIA